MEHLDRRALLGLAGIAGVAALSKSAAAGSLTPPGGAVAGTGRTLDEIYNKIPAANSVDGRIALSGVSTISTPGSYVLTGDVTILAGVGVAIASSNVTLDLNGYTIRSTANEGLGVAVGGAFTGVVVRNGSIASCNYGVSAICAGIVLEDLVVDNCRVRGIYVQNAAGTAGTAVVRRCSVTNTGVNSTAAEVNAAMGIGVQTMVPVIEDCSVSLVKTNTAAVGVYGIYSANATQGTIVNNRVLGVLGTGLRTNGAAGIVYRDNIVTATTTPYATAGATNAGGNTP